MKLTHSQIAQLCRSLALLLHAGVSLADGIFLIGQEQTGAIAERLQTMGKQMDEGFSLSEAMVRSDAFPRCAAGMVAVGEQTGRTEEVLELLARFYEQRSRTARRILRSLAYPAVILGMLLIVIGVLLVQVLTPEEVDPTYSGRVNLIDSESGGVEDPRNLKIRINRANYEAYAEALHDLREEMRSFCVSRGAEFVSVSTDQPIEKMLFKELLKVGIIA